MKPDREKALDMWAARKPDGGFVHRDTDEIAYECGYEHGGSVRLMVWRARRRGDVRAVKRPFGPLRTKWQRVLELREKGLSNDTIAQRLGSSTNCIASIASQRKKSTSKAA